MSEAPAPSTHQPDGLLDEKLTRVFGRSWRTGLFGLVSLVGAVVPLIPGLPASVVDVMHTVAAIAAGGGLLVSKDARVSGLPR